MLCGQPGEADVVRYMSLFYDVTTPLVRSPHDLLRLMNALSVSWPAIGKELNIADFVAIEALRVLRPGVFRALRNAKDRLYGIGSPLAVGSKTKPPNMTGNFSDRSRSRNAHTCVAPCGGCFPVSIVFGRTCTTQTTRCGRASDRFVPKRISRRTSGSHSAMNRCRGMRLAS